MSLLMLSLAWITSGSLLQATPADTIRADDYRIYTSTGESTTLAALTGAMAETDVIFIGETHDDPVVHYLEDLLLQRSYRQQFRGEADPIALSLEMFSRDVQYILNEYLDDLITEDQFRAASNPWKNYDPDYRPMVEFARVHHLDVVAANAPRRYANRVSRLGRESLGALSDGVLKFLAPLPYGEASEEYKKQWTQAMIEAMEEMGEAAASDSSEEKTDESNAMPAMKTGGKEVQHLPEGHPDPNAETGNTDDSKETDENATASGGMHGMNFILDSQSLWDATMAYSIADYLTSHPGTRVLHVVGGFHVATGTGIPEHLARYRPGTRTLIISVEPAENVEEFDPEEHADRGDFVILTNESLPRTFDALEN